MRDAFSLAFAVGARLDARQRLAATLIVRQVQGDAIADATLTQLVSLHYTARVMPRWTLGGSLRRYAQAPTAMTSYGVGVEGGYMAWRGVWIAAGYNLIGSTAGNPVLTQQWNTAQTQLQAVSNDLDKMNILANEMSGNVTFANYVLDSIHNAFGLAGAVEEDHRQLQQLEQMTYQASQQLQRLVGDLSGDISRQSAFLYAERNNLSTLALAINSGQPMGPAFSNTLSYMPAPAPAASQSGLAANRPLVTIRFDQPNVQYQQPLYQAVRVAMDRRPNAAFDLVAIPAAATTPSQQSANYAVARQYADQVMRSLIGMGVPVDRVSVRTASGQTTPSSEVRLYVR